MVLRSSRPQTRADQLAERQAAQNDAFLREVDDALREDNVLGALRRHGKLALAVVVLGLGGLGGWLWWDNHQQDVAAQRSEKLVVALDQIQAGRADMAAPTLAELAASGVAGPAALARLEQAGIALQQNKADQAATLYAAVAGDAGAPQPYRDFANIRYVNLKFDQLKSEEVVARLKPLAVPGKPWFGAAGELVAMAYLAQGHKELAAPLLGAIAKDTTQPETLRARTRQIAGTLGFDAIDDIAKAPAVPAAAQPAPAPQAAPAPAATAPAKP
ncbi:MAG TPA: tetratricopeptide repeat protein [Novosphingobium sp.]|nr:tetratricopeptide repeat protein [Novosphingobium sp.]